MKKHNILLLCCCALYMLADAQTTTPTLPLFQPVASEAVRPELLVGRDHTPEKWAAYQLDYRALATALQSAPTEYAATAKQQNCTLLFPNPDGALEAFNVWQTDIMAPELAQKFPMIRTYAGKSVETPGKTVRLTLSPRGVRLMMLRPDLSCAYLEPVQWGQPEQYLMYEGRDAAGPAASQPKACATPEDNDHSAHALPELLSTQVADRSAGAELRTIRFAISTNGEFSQDHGGTKESVLAAVVEYANMMSAIYERDMGARLQLVANTDKLIFLDPATDQFVGTEVGEHANANQLLVNSLIGINNFDVGHVFTRYIQGSAIGVSLGLGIACTTSKAAACSAGNGQNNYGQSFIGTACHEVSHQLSGPHSWNRCGDNSGGQRSGNSAVEPGSGTTIMSYAGACGGDDVKQGKDLYFHGATINIVRRFITNGNGCGLKTEAPNNIPTVTLPYLEQSDFVIPKGTAFELVGTATDPDGDALTYCWEQIDTGPEAPLGQASGSSPLFRSFPAVNTPVRSFPLVSTIFKNLADPRELMPDTTREMTFMLTVRDNKAEGGAVSQAVVGFHATENAGPFEITTPNTTGQIWRTGQYEQVAWKVANTDKAPVNCSKVNIRMSLDNGATFPIMLAEGTENDGSHYVLVPNQLSNAVRIRVEAVDNVFLDYSNRPFRILNPTQPTFTMSVSTESAELCLPTTFSVTIAAAGTLGFSTPATLRIKDENALPPASKYTFSNTTLAPGNSVTFNLELPNAVGSRSDSFVIVADVPGFGVLERAISLRTLRNDFSDLLLQSPTDGAGGSALSQTLRWQKSADATAYDVQLSTSPAFNAADIIASKSGITLDSFKVLVQLQKSKAYYWRVRPINACGTGPWMEPSFFATFTDNCTIVSANDLPKTIPSSGTPTVESKITLNSGVTVENVAIPMLKFNHQFFKELDATLISPQGTEVTLFKNKCGGQNATFSFAFSDGAPSVLDCQSLLGGVKTVRPETPLAAFKGQNAMGAWTLRMRDNTSSSGGSIQDFRLEFCSSVSLSAPILVKNEGLSMEIGEQKTIEAAVLLAEDQNTGPNQLVFTLVTVPQYGTLEKNGVALKPGDTFTQADINAGVVRFVNSGSGQQEDYFRFTISDGEGGFMGTPKFVIRTNTVSAGEPLDAPNAFNLYPNPATEQVWITFAKPLQAETGIELMDVSGRLIRRILAAAGAVQQVMPLDALPSGLYFVKVENSRGGQTKKLMVRF